MPFITEPARPGAKPIAETWNGDQLAVKRMAEPEEITCMVLFLASEVSAFITGSDYVIDGGRLIGPVVPADA